ncbi:hypothetical protein V6N13_127098 [Hibiscus sabdariffa]
MGNSDLFHSQAHESLMTLPNFGVVDLCYAGKQAILLDFHKKLIQRVTSFWAEKYSLGGSRFFQQELSYSSKIFVEFLEQGAVKKRTSNKEQETMDHATNK